MCRAVSSIRSKTGALAAADENDMQSPETYLGYGRGQNFASNTPQPDKPADYKTPYPLGPNQWGLTGRWTISEEKSVADAAGAKITFYFHARDLHLVLGPAMGGRPVRFKVMLDGQAPGAMHGVDADEAGNGTVTGQRLYQLIRQKDGQVTRSHIQHRIPGSGRRGVLLYIWMTQIWQRRAWPFA